MTSIKFRSPFTPRDFPGFPSDFSMVLRLVLVYGFSASIFSRCSDWVDFFRVRKIILLSFANRFPSNFSPKLKKQSDCIKFRKNSEMKIFFYCHPSSSCVVFLLVWFYWMLISFKCLTIFIHVNSIVEKIYFLLCFRGFHSLVCLVFHQNFLLKFSWFPGLSAFVENVFSTKYLELSLPVILRLKTIKFNYWSNANIWFCRALC